jgi:transglutaminase-like putative cysteine protease
MIGAPITIRQWSAIASAVAQLAATAAGMVPWWALPLTLVLTGFVSRPQRPSDAIRGRLIRGGGVAVVGLFAGVIAFKTVAAGRTGADPIVTLRSLTEALVVLSLVMAPSAQTPREYRVWLTVTTGVLVAAAAGGHTGVAAAVSLGSWVTLLIAITKVQAAAAVIAGAVPAVTVDTAMRPTTGRSGGQRGTLVPVGAALIAGVLVYLVLPSGLGGGGFAKRIAGSVTSPTTSAGSTRTTVGVDTLGDGELSLVVRGELPDTPILKVPARSPALWRGTFYSTYTGQAWEANGNQQFTLARGNNVDVPASATDPPPAGRQRSDVAMYEPGFRGSLLWSPGVPRHVTGLGGRIEAVTREPSNARLLAAGHLDGYRVTSAVATTSPGRLRAAVGSDPSDPQWTQLPRTLPAEVYQLARQVTANSTTRYEQVTAVEAYLRAHETYTEASPVPGPTDDAVDDFLFRDHEGFCEQFASAEAVMLRTLGVPTRVVSGLAYGIPLGPTRLLTAANAHAWVETYYPGLGWSPSDPTAGSTPAPAAVSRHSWLPRLLGHLSDLLPGGRAALAAIGLGLLLVTAWVGRGALRTRRRPGRGRRRSPVVGPVLSAFQRLTTHPHGPAPRAPAETAREYVARVAPPGALGAAVDTLEQECYGHEAPPPQASADAVRAFTDLVRR